MNEQTMKRIILVGVSMVTNNLTNSELAVLNNIVQTDMNPHNRLFDYAKVQSLFILEDGTRTHIEMQQRLILGVRLEK